MLPRLRQKFVLSGSQLVLGVRLAEQPPKCILRLVKEQELSKCRDKRPGRITVNSEDAIMPVHAQKASRFTMGLQFLRSCGFNIIVATKLACVNG